MIVSNTTNLLYRRQSFVLVLLLGCGQVFVWFCLPFSWVCDVEGELLSDTDTVGWSLGILDSSQCARLPARHTLFNASYQYCTFMGVAVDCTFLILDDVHCYPLGYLLDICVSFLEKHLIRLLFLSHFFLCISQWWELVLRVCMLKQIVKDKIDWSFYTKMSLISEEHNTKQRNLASDL